MVDDEVQLRPVRGRLHHVVGVPEQGRVVRPAGLRPVRREALVDADVEEPGVLLELLLVVDDDLVDRIRHGLVVEPPPDHEAVGVGV